MTAHLTPVSDPPTGAGSEAPAAAWKTAAGARGCALLLLRFDRVDVPVLNRAGLREIAWRHRTGGAA